MRFAVGQTEHPSCDHEYRSETMTSKQSPTQCITIKKGPKKKITIKIKKNKGNKCVLCPRTDCIKKDQWGHWICSDDEDEPETDDECIGAKPPINPQAGYTTEDEGDVPSDLDEGCVLCGAEKNLFYTKQSNSCLEILCGSACSENPFSPQYEPYCDDCEGKCRADELEQCEKCGIKLRIGCANNPSDHSIFNDLCDDCREYEEHENKLLQKQYELTMKDRKEKIQLLESLVEEGSTLNKKYYEENKQQTFEEWFEDNYK